MKKHILTLLIFMAFTLVNAQIVEKGEFFFNLGAGFGLENSDTNWESDSNDVAVPGLLNFTAEYIVVNRFGIAVRAERNGYLTDNEDSLTVVSNNFLLGPTFHVLNNNKHTLYFGVLLGHSRIKWTSEIPEEEANDYYIESSGFTAQFNLGGMVYFSKHLGLFYEAGYAHRNYIELTVHDKSNTPTENILVIENNPFTSNDDVPVEIALNGVDLRVGLSIKF